MLTNFSLASSNAAMPFNIKSCQNLGISQKVCAFSIPLGATLNMDGSCIYMGKIGEIIAYGDSDKYDIILDMTQDNWYGSR